MPGLMAQFDPRNISKRIDKFKKERIQKEFDFLTYIGIKAVTYAKTKHTYHDQTGNLTSSIGYAIIIDGDIVRTGGGKSTFIKGDGNPTKIASTEMGRFNAMNVLDDIAAQYPTGMILVVVAGMEYAAAVESKGYDVITGSSREAEKLRDYIKKQVGAALL
jgi:hypothetical protein